MIYSQSSCKRWLRKFEKAVVTLVSDRMVKKYFTLRNELNSTGVCFRSVFLYTCLNTGVNSKSSGPSDMSLQAMDRLYKTRVLAKQNGSLRQSCCATTSNRHVHFLTLFVTCKLHVGAISVLYHKGWFVTGKVKTFTDTVLRLL